MQEEGHSEPNENELMRGESDTEDDDDENAEDGVLVSVPLVVDVAVVEVTGGKISFGKDNKNLF